MTTKLTRVARTYTVASLWRPEGTVYYVHTPWGALMGDGIGFTTPFTTREAAQADADNWARIDAEDGFDDDDPRYDPGECVRDAYDDAILGSRGEV